MAAIKGEKNLQQLADQFDIHVNQVTDWNAQLWQLRAAAERLIQSSSVPRSTPT
ncbi:MAG: hypothetical protein ACKVP3_07575 [Hyphomicrobiaceae bacterium]